MSTALNSQSNQVKTMHIMAACPKCSGEFLVCCPNCEKNDHWVEKTEAQVTCSCGQIIDHAVCGCKATIASKFLSVPAAERIKSVEKNIMWDKIIGGVIVVFLGMVVVYKVKDFVVKELPSATAYSVIREMMKSPSENRLNKNEVIWQGDLNGDGLKDYIVHIDVEAKNSFGAYVRGQYLVKVSEGPGREGYTYHTELPYKFYEITPGHDVNDALGVYKTLFVPTQKKVEEPKAKSSSEEAAKGSAAPPMESLPPYLEYFLPKDGVIVEVTHDGGAKGSIQYQWTPTESGTQVRSVHRVAGKETIEDFLVGPMCEVKTAAGAETLVCIVKLAQSSSKTEPEALTFLPPRAGGKIIRNGEEYLITNIDDKVNNGAKVIENCIRAEGGKYRTEIFYCKGFGIVRNWSHGSPAGTSKGFY